MIKLKISTRGYIRNRVKIRKGKLSTSFVCILKPLYFVKIHPPLFGLGQAIFLDYTKNLNFIELLNNMSEKSSSKEFLAKYIYKKWIFGPAPIFSIFTDKRS